MSLLCISVVKKLWGVKPEMLVVRVSRFIVRKITNDVIADSRFSVGAVKDWGIFNWRLSFGD
jgi:hypothetical protein